MGHDDPGVAYPHDLTGLDIFRALQGKHHTPDHSGNIGDGIEGDGRHGIFQAAAQYGHHHDGQQQAGEGQQEVHKPGDQGIQPTAVITGQHPQGHADGGADDGAHKAHQQGDPGAVDHTGQGIPAQVIRAQQVLPAGRGIFVGNVLGVGVLGAQEGADEGHEQEQKQDNAADEGGLSADKTLKNIGCHRYAPSYS